MTVMVWGPVALVALEAAAVVGETVDTAAEDDRAVEVVEVDDADDEVTMVEEVDEEAVADETGALDIADDAGDEAAEVAVVSLRPPMMFPF